MLQYFTDIIFEYFNSIEHRKLLVKCLKEREMSNCNKYCSCTFHMCQKIYCYCSCALGLYCSCHLLVTFNSNLKSSCIYCTCPIVIHLSGGRKMQNKCIKCEALKKYSIKRNLDTDFYGHKRLSLNDIQDDYKGQLYIKLKSIN